MFTKESKIINNKQNLSNYISGYDVYNSSLLIYLNDPQIERENYEIMTYTFRPDLIAQDHYGDVSYEGLVVLMASIGLESYTKGNVIQLIPKSVLDSILSNI